MSLIKYEPVLEEKNCFLLAERMVKTGFFDSIKYPEQAYAIILAGAELGFPPLVSLRSLHIVQGKPVLSAEAMVALVKKSPACMYFHLGESSSEKAVYETLRKGEPASTRLSFSILQAKAAGLLQKTSWRLYPDAMLRARCASQLARAVYPDVVGGIYHEDELDEVERILPQSISINMEKSIERENNEEEPTSTSL